MFNKLLLTAAIGLATTRLWAGPLDLSLAKIVVLNPRQSTSVKAAAMLRDEVEKRTRIVLEIANAIPAGEGPVILIGTVPDLAAQSYPLSTAITMPATADAYAIWLGAHGQAPAICAAGQD